MEIGAVLDHIHLNSPHPRKVAEFYARHFGLTMRENDGVFICEGPGRIVAVSAGIANRLEYAAWCFDSQHALAAYRDRVPAGLRIAAPASPLLRAHDFAVRDPDGNVIAFTLARPHTGAGSGTPPPARSQHFALRTPDPARLLAFYANDLGFTLSDRVQDESGVLRACFLRTDALHHALALFMAPDSRFDHQSFETPSWDNLRDWADHMAALGLPLHWGVGRHGPGNDVFFMVLDPDGNLAEISSEIEVCAPGRPAGLWPHEQRTLNLWGTAITRS